MDYVQNLANSELDKVIESLRVRFEVLENAYNQDAGCCDTCFYKDDIGQLINGFLIGC